MDAERKDTYYEIKPKIAFSLNLRELIEYRELFYFFTWRDVKVKYKQTALRLLWAILQPLLMTLIFTFFIGKAMNMPSDDMGYPVFAFSGLILWTLFSSGITNAGNSMVSNAQIIKKIYFPRLIIPISSILVSVFDFFIAFLVLVVEDGNPIYNYARSLTYNANWMIATEQGIENGDEVIRTFHYDANEKWIGITTTVNGVALDDQLTIDDQGQVTSYTHDGIRLEFVWRANNPRLIKTYVQPGMAMNKAQKSKAFDKIGHTKMARDLARIKILESLSELQKTTKSSYRSKTTEDWVLVQIEELEVDHRIVQPFLSPANGYPGTTGDGGWLYRSKNFITKFTDYVINPGGSIGEEVFMAHNHTVQIRDNLPKQVLYSSKILLGADDEDNPIYWNETGTMLLLLSIHQHQRRSVVKMHQTKPHQSY